ncbi:MAG TPA: alpha/beta hydrolase [Steroidobacteraceae bacterium]|nr:alpha/beta hydrolase [Steroidobacteraceae bacterium]
MASGALLNEPKFTSQGASSRIAGPASYLRRIEVPGGTIRRWWLHAFLRMSSRRASYLDANIGALRLEQRKWDERFARPDQNARHTLVRGADFAGEWLEWADSDPSRVILYLHGGAFLFHWPRIYAGMVGSWCTPLRARALLVDYRLAPEFPFPAAADDCLAAYRWLHGQGYSAPDVVLAGDSAGANLALVTLQRLHALGEALPACVVLLSAGLDFTLSGRSVVANDGRDPMFSLAGLAALRSFYAPPEQYLNPAVSPLFGDFSGLPPLLFQVGERELLLDESTRAAARAHAAGVTVELEIWERMGHGFQALPLPQAQSAADHVVAFVERHAGWKASRSTTRLGH